ncbi:hypothetical protein D1BOALGB6SA_6941 [Olavius sp. associated proteobacterium Delta 1]|nr:hypothetical protein D1BOALGB6SA_6941 [Olavius sp. associated proteobacterium Delta 1]
MLRIWNETDYSFSEIKKLRNRLVVKDNYLARNAIMKKKEFSDGKLIYSIWEVTCLKSSHFGINMASRY